MAEIRCKKCGMTARSKCPYCRSIFPHDQVTAATENYVSLNREEKVYPKTEWNEERQMETLHVSFHFEDTEFWTLEKVEKFFRESLQRVNIQYLLCEHEWEFLPGEKSSISCGHRSREKRGDKR